MGGVHSYHSQTLRPAYASAVLKCFGALNTVETFKRSLHLCTCASAGSLFRAVRAGGGRAWSNDGRAAWLTAAAGQVGIPVRPLTNQIVPALGSFICRMPNADVYEWGRSRHGTSDFPTHLAGIPPDFSQIPEVGRTAAPVFGLWRARRLTLRSEHPCAYLICVNGCSVSGRSRTRLTLALIGGSLAPLPRRHSFGTGRHRAWHTV